MGRKPGRRRSPVNIFVAVALVIAAAGVGFWLTHRAAPPERTQPSGTAGERLPVMERQKVKVYVMKLVNEELKLVPETRSIPSDVDPPRAAIEKLIATNREAGTCQYLIPMGTKLLGLQVRGGVAYADFSRELRDNFNGGSDKEAFLVDSITRTLAQFKDVKKVQILVEGKRIDTLGGHFDISGPITPDSVTFGPGESE